MPAPTAGTERARWELAEAFFEYDLSENASKFVSNMVLPVKPVPEAHGTYPVVVAKELLRPVHGQGAVPAGEELNRAPRGAYERDDFVWTERTYKTQERGFETPVYDHEAAHYRNAFDHESEAAAWNLYRLMEARERRTAAALFNTTRFVATTASTYGDVATPGIGYNQAAGTYSWTEANNNNQAAVPWSTYATAQPKIDVAVARYKVFLHFGIKPDTMLINEQTWEHLRNVDEIRSEIQAAGAGTTAAIRDISTSQVAQVLNLREIIVAEAARDDGSFGNRINGDWIFGSGALVFKRIQGTSLRERGLGHTFHWTADGSRLPAFVESYREPQIRATVIRSRHQDEQFIKEDIGEFITDTY